MAIPSVLISGEARILRSHVGSPKLTITRPFELAVSGSNWWITTYETPQKIDPTNFHWQVFSVTDDLIAQCYYAPNAQKLFTTLKPLLAPVACPDQVSHFIWLTLAAPPQLAQPNTVFLPPIYNPSADLGTNPNLRRQCEVDYLDGSRLWPKQVRFFSDGTFNQYSNGTNFTRRHPAPFGKGFLEASFTSLETTNWSGVEIPIRVWGEIFGPGSGQLKTNGLIEIQVTGLEPLATNIFLPPAPPAGLPIFDARTPSAPNQGIGFNVKDGAWPSLETSRAALEAARAESAKRGPRSR